jgi:pimeloyl-ACP methyl ester carboxylesterase
MPHFLHGGHRLAYTVYGAGPRTTVLLHGLLLSQKMHRPLAKTLARRGNRVVTLDLLGHGQSDRPRDMTAYSMPFFGEQIIGLLDHLELDEAVLAGTSLGANATLEAAAAHPERVLGCAIAFTPLMCALTFGEPAMKGVSWLTRRIPTGAFWGADILLDTVRQQPGPSAAVLQGLFFGRVAPHKEVRKTIAAPARVIGHDRDPVHPFSDSDALVSELPDARLLRADSLLELRLSPERLTTEIGEFLDHCWKPRRTAGGRTRRRRAATVA